MLTRNSARNCRNSVWIRLLKSRVSFLPNAGKDVSVFKEVARLTENESSLVGFCANVSSVLSMLSCPAGLDEPPSEVETCTRKGVRQPDPH